MKPSGETIRQAILASYSQRLVGYCASDERRELVAARTAIAFAPSAFFSELAESTGLELQSIVSLFRDSSIVRFFSKIGWSFKKLYELLKMGAHAYRNLLDAISDYVSSTSVGKWTEGELKKLDAYLESHPKTRRIAGLGVAALLVYLWFLMADTGDADWDFDFSDVLAALGGNYALSELFAGPEGAKMLLAIAAGTILRASFPWPGPESVRFVGAIIYTLAGKFRKKLFRQKESSCEKELLTVARQILSES